MAERLNTNWACLVNCLGDEGRSAAAGLLTGTFASIRSGTALSLCEIDGLRVYLSPYAAINCATPTHRANREASKGGGLQSRHPLAGGQQVL